MTGKLGLRWPLENVLFSQSWVAFGISYDERQFFCTHILQNLQAGAGRFWYSFDSPHLSNQSLEWSPTPYSPAVRTHRGRPSNIMTGSLPQPILPERGNLRAHVGLKQVQKKSGMFSHALAIKQLLPWVQKWSDVYTAVFSRWQPHNVYRRCRKALKTSLAGRHMKRHGHRNVRDL